MNDKDLEKLIFGMAHQIRNPCAIIKANANLLLKKQPLSAEAVQSMDAILNGVKYLEDRLDEFVEFSKPLRLKPRPVSVHQVCQDVVSIVKDKCQLQKTKISCNVDTELVLQKADPQLILLALLNVVLNAVESLKVGGTVTVSAQKFGEEALLVVQDTGCGIHPRDLPEVFSPFYSTKEGGIGIGLAVVKRIIETHQGSVELTSKQGQGTTVSIRLPLN